MYAGPQLNWYKNDGARYRPDLVIQFVYGSMAVNADPPPNASLWINSAILPSKTCRHLISGAST
ncbi:MAG: hypothetical protein RJB58_2335 [Pseudomonadota bacterium]